MYVIQAAASLLEYYYPNSLKNNNKQLKKVKNPFIWTQMKELNTDNANAMAKIVTQRHKVTIN